MWTIVSYELRQNLEPSPLGPRQNAELELRMRSGSEAPDGSRFLDKDCPISLSELS